MEDGAFGSVLNEAKHTGHLPAFPPVCKSISESRRRDNLIYALLPTLLELGEVLETALLDAGLELDP